MAHYEIVIPFGLFLLSALLFWLGAKLYEQRSDFYFLTVFFNAMGLGIQLVNVDFLRYIAEDNSITYIETSLTYIYWIMMFVLGAYVGMAFLVYFVERLEKLAQKRKPNKTF